MNGKRRHAGLHSLPLDVWEEILIHLPTVVEVCRMKEVNSSFSSLVILDVLRRRAVERAGFQPTIDLRDTQSMCHFERAWRGVRLVPFSKMKPNYLHSCIVAERKGGPLVVGREVHYFRLNHIYISRQHVRIEFRKDESNLADVIVLGRNGVRFDVDDELAVIVEQGGRFSACLGLEFEVTPSSDMWYRVEYV